ncbi:hypothetical protein EJ05DRAFT_495616 [Pseudovirgaria hyperparasitica]|uniref:Uncharacterized protein n=1 Tax=Pseudovirgaria hyperparasitica TaxID=470096 RepID=A0A6A6WKQ9_9PEZI|nr:uncharacterized protein EJ05DRAFT_495616 [Pseudovirgaria hyperparasitica]KAF2762753.1 hypothetical protein EJ05DRAFT_495616 [Pseudovirgaria hyperparasitica]
MDFRRPALGTAWNPGPSNHQDLVIDLTAEDEDEVRPENETRGSIRAAGPPQFPHGREIIDLSADASTVVESDPDTGPRRPPAESPDIEFLSSRPRRGRPSAQWQVRSRENVSTPLFMGHNFEEMLADMDVDPDEDLDEDLDLQFLREEPRLQPRLAQDLPQPPHRTARMTAFIENIRGNMNEILDMGHGRLGRIAGFQLPGLLDFDAVGFHIAQPRAPTPPAPTYEAPSPAPLGFTRSPEEDEILICPNCQDELCTGNDDTKRQVWIIRACGHIYCGECTQNRSMSKRKGKSKALFEAAPFSACVVDDCMSNVKPPKSMIQIFL